MQLQESDDETNESVGYGSVSSKLTFTSSQSPVETLEKGVKYVQS